MLQPWAVCEDSGHFLLARQYGEEPSAYRSELQRDRDRIVHSRAFRRLEYKTQVFVNHLGDNFRTRLTHSIEVAQIARTVARALGLNEDLAETIALAHDLGHPPFGHAGERALQQLMREHGGFDHNQQSLRILELIEERYPHCPGLNLTTVTRMGLQKHDLLVNGFSHTLEAQVVDFCDEIAYNNHDLDDGIDSGYLKPDELQQVALWQEMWQQTESRYGQAGTKVKMRYTIRNLINRMVGDLVEHTSSAIAAEKIESLDDVLNFHQRQKGQLAGFSQMMAAEMAAMKAFLFDRLYRHPEVKNMNLRGDEIIRFLFDYFLDNSGRLPPEYQVIVQNEGIYRAVADFVSGMTDRYALAWFEKIR